MNDPNHPLWKFLKYTVSTVTLTVACMFLYKNGFDLKDIILILGNLAVLIGLDITKIISSRN